MRKLFTIASGVVLLVSIAGPALAAPGNPNGLAKGLNKSDNLPGVLAQKQAGLKAAAQEAVLKGKAKAKGANQVVKVANGQYVELAFEGEDPILTLLGEFGEDPATHNHGTFGVIDHGGAAGPEHNQIPEPDRSVDNTTIWTGDFSQAYYDALLYDKGQRPSMANWYLQQSSGRYSVDGYVGDWTLLPFNEAAYGSNYCGGIVCTRDIGRFVEDLADNWWTDLVADQGSVAAANDFLADFDVWDRYDFDGDGNFDEPDGYIDHFQAVHAGEGEETGGGAQGTDAIWSHRSYVNSVPVGADGPPGGPAFGGAHIGTSDYWIGDYTVEPENGGVGVFTHEFGHDLNLPDEYDTSGNTGGAENGTGWWTNWSQGSYGTISEDLGSYPVGATAWEKFQLGWLVYGVGFTGKNSTFKLGPLENTTKQNQGVFVVLPDKHYTVHAADPWSGDFFYHSGAGNNLDNTMTKEVTLGAGPITASFDASYQIEPCWDYAYLQVSTDGTNFTNIHTSASAGPAFDANGQDFGEGITGISGTPLACDDNLNPTPTVTNVTADLSAYANQHVWVRFRYWTDGFAGGTGFAIDNLAITGQTLDDAESADLGWTFAGFIRTNGDVEKTAFNAYVAEYRQYREYDIALKSGPYNFVDPLGTEGLPNWVEHFPYQDGLLIWYWNAQYEDNNVGDHPGGGLILPIDAHPDILHWSDGSTARPRIQSYDATFGFWPTEPISLHNLSAGLTLTRSSLPAVSVFNDMNSYWVADDPGDNGADGRYQAEWNSVNHPHTGTTISIVGLSAQGSFMQINVK